MNYLLRKGLNIPAVTIVDEAGRVITEDQRRLFRHLAQSGYGADEIFGVGTTGEWNRLTNAERQRVMEIEVEEVRYINSKLANRQSSTANQQLVEAWVGVNGKTRAEILSNLDLAIQLGVDSAVIAPLAIEDLKEQDIVRFFQRDITDLLEAVLPPGRELPVFLYDNADIAAAGQPPHIRTQIVKHLSRLPWVRGIKVSASRRVIGNYTKAALHYKQPGEFGIYIGNAMLIFEMYRPSHTLFERLREGWRDYLLNDVAPIGVISGPANCMPREWQKAWRVCWAGDEELTDVYQDVCERFETACAFDEGGQTVRKTIACVKAALEIDGVVTSSRVCAGTKPLTSEQKAVFKDRYLALRDYVKGRIDPLWQTVNAEARSLEGLRSQG
ncbi:MAG TPA: dihydrodipicolinate synthase family protein [Blastocatellia bacterium]|nr:dihydrodipicolinate synthase family protein [Blastocatellia bacterium]HMV84644.1 dihydrodipicolinate synthase family protein [Blastocatellia bacterium]HMX27117.1 dihydrodipicolinate synthase family protein [Blastocatellia bacterium]HMZ18728.1 dihydrodipicolinate synthase family protein [Blastocatellia bacterium]HNG29015.1 dihydrodipicolinate synthase family protein [Blastocatellia bacterium]